MGLLAFNQRKAAVHFDDFVNLAHQTNRFSERDGDFTLMGNVFGEERSRLSALSHLRQTW